METQQTPNKKCSNCYCYWIPDTTDIKTSGLQFKTCRKCRDRQTQEQERLFQYKNETVLCFCGKSYIRKQFLRHIRSKIHSFNNDLDN
jgi:hypothetical protein